MAHVTVLHGMSLSILVQPEAIKALPSLQIGRWSSAFSTSGKLAMGLVSLLSSLAAILMMVVVSAGDEAALLAFKAQASGGAGGSRALASWNDSAHFCSWEGVTCSHRRTKQVVVALSLHRGELTGALSPVLGNLTFLRTLNLSYNSLHGEIPASLGRLRLLKNLDLSHNQLVGSIPPELGSIQSMQILQLSANKLSGMLPHALYNLSSLERFQVGGNKLNGSIPVDIGNKYPACKFLIWALISSQEPSLRHCPIYLISRYWSSS